MNEDLWRSLSDLGRPCHVKKGTCINGNTEEPSDDAYLLEEGICALASINDKGEEQVYLYFGARRLIGFNQLFTTRHSHPAHDPKFLIIA